MKKTRWKYLLPRCTQRKYSSLRQLELLAELRKRDVRISYAPLSTKTISKLEVTSNTHLNHGARSTDSRPSHHHSGYMKMVRVFPFGQISAQASREGSWLLEMMEMIHECAVLFLVLEFG